MAAAATDVAEASNVAAAAVAVVVPAIAAAAVAFDAFSVNQDWELTAAAVGSYYCYC